MLCFFPTQKKREERGEGGGGGYTQGLLDGEGVSNSGGGRLGGVGGTVDLALNSLEVLDVHCSVAGCA